MKIAGLRALAFTLAENISGRKMIELAHAVIGQPVDQPRDRGHVDFLDLDTIAVEILEGRGRMPGRIDGRYQFWQPVEITLGHGYPAARSGTLT